MKSDVLLLACVFEKFIKISIKEKDINPLYRASLPGYTWQCGLKYSGRNLQTLQDEYLILTIENNIRGGISSGMGDRYFKSSDKIRYDIWMLLFYMDILWFNLYLMMNKKFIKMLH